MDFSQRVQAVDAAQHARQNELVQRFRAEQEHQAEIARLWAVIAGDAANTLSSVRKQKVYVEVYVRSGVLVPGSPTLGRNPSKIKRMNKKMWVLECGVGRRVLLDETHWAHSRYGDLVPTYLRIGDPNQTRTVDQHGGGYRVFSADCAPFNAVLRDGLLQLEHVSKHDGARTYTELADVIAGGVHKLLAT